MPDLKPLLNGKDQDQEIKAHQGKHTYHQGILAFNKALDNADFILLDLVLRRCFGKEIGLLPKHFSIWHKRTPTSSCLEVN